MIRLFCICLLFWALFELDRADDEPQEEEWGSYNEERQ